MEVANPWRPRSVNRQKGIYIASTYLGCPPVIEVLNQRIVETLTFVTIFALMRRIHPRPTSCR